MLLQRRFKIVVEHFNQFLYVTLKDAISFSDDVITIFSSFISGKRFGCVQPMFTTISIGDLIMFLLHT